MTAIAGAGLGLLALDAPAHAADIPLKAPAMATVFDWTGLYIGAHTGFSRGASSAILSDPAPDTTSNVFGGQIGGVQAGYNYRSSSGVLVGVEADISFPNYFTSNKIVSSLTTANSASSKRGTTSERRAAASAMPRAPHCSTSPAASPGPANASPTRPLSEPTKRSSTRGLAGPPAPDWNMASLRTGA